MNILVVCAGGISTSILVENMKMHADNYDTIKATSLDHLKHYIDNVDVVLAAPQISFAIEQLEMKCKEKNIPLFVIDKQIYGNMDGKAVMANLKKSLQNMSLNDRKIKYTIAIFCASSLSFEKLNAKLQTEIPNNKTIVQMKKINSNEINKLTFDEDLVVLTPQTRYLYEDLKTKYSEEKIYYIDMDTYAFLNLDKIAKKILVKLNILKEEL